MLYKKLSVLCLSAILIMACNSSKTKENTSNSIDTTTIEGHPAWIMQGNIYEVNVRQYTPEGTFNAFAKHLDRLKEMGVQALWFMPINPIGVFDRKGTLGSYYAVANYTAINPEFGTLEDWNALVMKCHEMGFKVIIDWVANHTSADHYWLKTNPDFYVQDSITHKALSPFDWTDARKLNFKNPALCDSMIASMEYWLKESNLDGFRCDVASEVPEAFWTKCISQLKKGRNIFMLAEAETPWIHKAGFDASYAWSDFNVMKQIVKGERNALSLDTVFAKRDTSFPTNAMKLSFTSNHDENSWNKADYGTMPGETHAPFAVLTQTINKGVSLIYTGQEEPYLDSISFFYKHPITFGKYNRAAFYNTLLNLRKDNPALAANASYTKLTTNDNAKIFAFLRENEGRKVLVVLNLSKDPVKALISNSSIVGKATEVFTKASEQIIQNQTILLKPWDYKVYSY